MTSFSPCPSFTFTGPLDCHNTFKIVYFRPECIWQGLISSVIILKYIFTLYPIHISTLIVLTLKY